MGRVHTAVFLIDVSDFKSVCLLLPASHQIGCTVGGTIVHHQPDKVFAFLAAQALVGARQGMGTVVGGGKNSKNRISSFVHTRSNRIPVV